MIPLMHIEGSFSREAAHPGMAYFAGTGPKGQTCVDCVHRCFLIHGDKFKRCAMYSKLFGGKRGKPVRTYYRACKYFELK